MSVAIWQALALEGDVEAQLSLGAAYSEGDGVQENLKLAYKWYLMAAKRGNKFAEKKVTLLFHDNLKAEALAGDIGAQLSLGYIFRNGDGVKVSWVEAAKWYRMAAAQGSEYAYSVLEQMGLAELPSKN